MGSLLLKIGLVSLTLCSQGSIATPLGKSNLYSRADAIKSEYDYIVVGGGTAGLVVADRLTENGRNSVLVVELGKFENSSSVTTVAGGFLGLIDPTLTFRFPSVPQTGLNGRTIDVYGGVMLGGSSGVNGMQVHRGQKEDYDRWADYFDRRPAGWGWNGLLPYFKKAWNFHPPTRQLQQEFNIKYDTRFWGNTAKIHASWPTFQYPSMKYEVAALGEIPGVQYPPDSGAGQPGVFWYPASVNPFTVLRSMSRNGHWDGIEAARPNYDTLVSHKVLRVTFRGRTASGVTFVPVNATNESAARTVKARKEIILAAGTIHTPQILQRSGIGPKSVLRAAGVSVVEDLPGVGSNFQDHPFSIGASFNFTSFPFAIDVNDIFTNATFIAEATAQFEANRTGPLSIASGNAGCFLPLPVIAPDTFRSIAARFAAQDPAAFLPAGVDSTVVAGYRAQQAAFVKAMRSSGAAFYNLFIRGAQDEGAIVYLHPLSRGTVHLNPSDPVFGEPLVDYRALSNPIDADILVEFVRFTRRIMTQTSLSDWDPVETQPGAGLTTPEQLIASIRTTMIPSSFHPIGTAAMMPRRLGGVVDENLLVYGVKGLSVVDASVMPDLPGAYTQQTVYAIAEKAADLIKGRT